eukprot:tig00000093_g3489.t1
MEKLEQKLFDELNEAREHPSRMRRALQELLPKFSGKLFKWSDGSYARTHEGKAAVEDAIEFLKSQPAVPPIEVLSPGLDAAAADHVKDLGPKGLKGHDGSDNSDPFDRMERHGDVLQRAYLTPFPRPRAQGENIFFGDESVTPKEIVQLLIIDDGIPDRGHRLNVFEMDYNAIGIECGPHKEMGVMCVFEYAQNFLEEDGTCSPAPCPAVPKPGTYTFTVPAGSKRPGEKVTFETPGRVPGVPVKHTLTVPYGVEVNDVELEVTIKEGIKEKTSKTMDELAAEERAKAAKEKEAEEAEKEEEGPKAAKAKAGEGKGKAGKAGAAGKEEEPQAEKAPGGLWEALLKEPLASLLSAEAGEEEGGALAAAAPEELLHAWDDLDAAAAEEEAAPSFL